VIHDVPCKAVESHLALGREQSERAAHVLNLVAANAGPQGSFFLREHGGAELTPPVPMAKRGVNCRAWDRRLIACRSAIHWLICDGSQAAVTVPHGNLA